MFRNSRELFYAISRSKFRSRFHLSNSDFEYINKKGAETIKSHALDFIEKRLSPAYISNDGKQTPMKGHPVFVAQHATACCCRGCLKKWHGIDTGCELTVNQKNYIVNVLMSWIYNEVENHAS